MKGDKMIKTITEHEFVDAIRGDEYNIMSYEGARALFKYIENLEDDIGEQLEFDRVGIRCDFSEYENLEEVLEQYSSIKNLRQLQDHTTVIEVPDSDKLIIENF